MADTEGNIDINKLAEFKKTVDTQWIKEVVKSEVTGNLEFKHVIQQKWANELGDEEWRDIPLVISE